METPFVLDPTHHTEEQTLQTLGKLSKQTSQFVFGVPAAHVMSSCQTNIFWCCSPSAAAELIGSMSQMTNKSPLCFFPPEILFYSA